MKNEPNRQRLGERAEDVFDRFLSGRQDSLHPDDHAEAGEFWDWVGGFERPETTTDFDAGRWRRPLAATIGFLAAVSACFVVAVIIPGLWHIDRGERHAQRFASGRAERRTIRLADGTLVRLAATSAIEVAFDRRERHVRLVAGEALFDIAHKPGPPFVVQVANGEIRDIGTSFNVSTDGSTATVTVVDGAVHVSVSPTSSESAVGEGALTKTARGGEQVRFGLRGAGTAAVGFISNEAIGSVDTATAWTRGLIYFNGEPLSDAIATVNRYSREQIVLTDKRQAGTPVYGVVNEGDPAALRELMAHPEALKVAQPVE